MDGIKFVNLTIDCADSKAMGEFYSKLLGWETTEAWGCPLVVSPDKQYGFLFVQEDDYVPPVWPEVEGKQQKQLHMDFQVQDYEGSIAKAIELGAKKAETQFGPEHFTVMLDPAGHPFCLCKG